MLERKVTSLYLLPYARPSSPRKYIVCCVMNDSMVPLHLLFHGMFRLPHTFSSRWEESPAAYAAPRNSLPD